jgi:hypothetical protein
MFRALALALLLVPAGAWAQSHDHMMHGAMMHAGASHGAQPTQPTQPGQAAFAAIQEIVAILEADPNTDWSKVDIDALRQHLVDMDHVTIFAHVTNIATDDGFRFEATGVGAVRDSIRRMLVAHAATMNDVNGWRFESAEIENGAALTVHAPAADRAKLKGLGLFGLLTLGMHHQMHHLMIARGLDPHKQPAAAAGP